MQWTLQHSEDMDRLAARLSAAGERWSMHKLVPFAGDLIPPPEVADPGDVLLSGGYGLWKQAEARGWRPGVFRLRPYLHEARWRSEMLNGDATVRRLDALPGWTGTGPWFLRPVSDAKEVAGRVHEADEIRALAAQVCALPEDHLPLGSLRPDTEMMLSRPARIDREWRVWIVDDRVVTGSLYREGARVTYRGGLPAEVEAYAARLVHLNPGYAPAYVIDVCRTGDGLRLLETNCLNAAGLYDADIGALIAALTAHRVAA